VRISGVVALVFQAYYLVILARVIFSWVRLPRKGILVEWIAPFVYGVTEPVLRPLRNVLRRYQGGVPLDLSPLVLILVLSLVETLVLRALWTVGL
jgi:YggT family protein